MKTLFYAVVLVSLLGLILEGYNHPWTGFAGYQLQNGDFVAAKTLWDWLDLLIVPLVLAIGAFLLDGSRKRSEQEVESDRQKQEILDEFIAYISELLIEKDLFNSTGPNAVREVARTRTLTALRLLDGKRKAQVLQFLYEAKLILANPVIQLNGADFRDALLDEATLSGAELRGVYFSGASIRRANLVGADLRGSDFSRVNFHESNLSNALLVQSTLDRSDLRAATLDNTDFSAVSLNKACMTNAQRAALLHKAGK
ncbi:MAG: pentapeptide repeat-containing protein [Gammaproteobacteria bacterium]|nr:pentapeptide repeat-containing protein [Gammaproteobacteria bacterium]